MGTVEQTPSPVEATAVPAPSSPAAPERPLSPPEQRFLIRNIDWATYRKISDALIDRHYHMSYDGEDLELMTTSVAHDRYGRFITRLVGVLTEEMGLPLDSCGQFTMDREDLERAIEADETFYIENEHKVRGKRNVDLSVDPPPDLGVEIDLTTDSRRRMKIYATIGIPEIWRYDGRSATFYLRQSDGQYAMAERSRIFPFFSPDDLSRFLQQREQLDENALLRSFRDWVRQQLGK